ncbi:MAG: DUF2007 domain-containing protein [Maricaulaceae bacterium]
MIEVLRTNDLVELSWAEAVLREAGLEPLVLDTHASAVEGSISAIQRRIVVDRADGGRARAALNAARAQLDDCTQTDE